MQTYLITKDDIGRTLFAIPTGNNICRYGRPRLSQLDQVQPVHIDKVARKYITIMGRTQISINCNGKGYIDKGCNNSGYVFFETLEDIEKLKVVKTIASQINVKYTYISNWEEISHEKMVQIAEILDLEY